MTKFEEQRYFPTNYAHSIANFVIRLALFAPLNIYRKKARNHWHLIQDHPELRGAAYGAEIASGEHLAASWGYFAFCWSLCVWIPFTIAVAPAHFVFTIIDIAITVHLFIATLKQGAYSTLNLSRCKDLQSWNLPEGANETFFDTAAGIPGVNGSRLSICEDFGTERRYGIAFSTIFLILAVIGTLSAINAVIQNHRKGVPQYRSIYLTFYPNMLLPPYVRFLILVGSGITAFAIIIAHGFIMNIFLTLCPWFVVCYIRFARRYIMKVAMRVKGMVQQKIRMMELKRENGGKEIQISRSEGAQTPLAEFLGVYDVLILVFQQLHFADVVNLSSTSKSIREIVLPANDPQRMKHLKMYTCTNGPKKQCWLCITPICDDCSVPCSIPQNHFCYHLDRCRLFCTRCYIQHVNSRVPTNRAGRQDKMEDAHCKCAPATNEPNLWVLNINGTNHYQTAQTKLPLVVRYLCKNCIKLEPSEVLERRDARSKLELRDPSAYKSGVGWDKCNKSGCDREIGSGPRWWVCVKCEWECKRLAHNAWGNGKHTEKANDEKV